MELFFKFLFLIFCCSVAQSCLSLCNPMDCSMPGFPWLSPGVCSKLMSIESVMPSSHFLLCHPFSSCPQSFPASVSSSELPLCIRWPEYWSFSFNISPSNEYSGLISFRIDLFDPTAVQGIQDSSPQPQFKSINSALSLLWSKFNIHTRLLGKLQLWLYRPLSAK